MDFHAIELIDPPLPRLEMGAGDLLMPVAHHGDPFTPVTARLAGPVGSIQYLVCSRSSLPSSNRYLSLDLGNQFTEVSFVRALVMPAKGWIDLVCYGPNLPDPGSGSVTVYAQQFQFARPFPFRVSNLESLVVLP
jgi:hypothetical protein